MRQASRVGRSCPLFVISDGELQVTRHDTVLLVIASGIASKLKNLGSEVLEDGREVN